MRTNARVKVILSQGAIMLLAVREVPCFKARLCRRKSGAVPWHSRWLGTQTQRHSIVDRPKRDACCYRANVAALLR